MTGSSFVGAGVSSPFLNSLLVGSYSEGPVFTGPHDLLNLPPWIYVDKYGYVSPGG